MGILDAILGGKVIAAVIMLLGAHFDAMAMKAALHRGIAEDKVPCEIFRLHEHAVPRTNAGKPKKPLLTQELAWRLMTQAAAT